MCREHLVILVGTKKPVVSLCELRPHQQRLHATGKQHDEGGYDVTHPDCMVRGVREPSQDAARMTPGAFELLQFFSLVNGFRDYILGRSHFRLSRYSMSGCSSVGFTAMVAI